MTIDRRDGWGGRGWAPMILLAAAVASGCSSDARARGSEEGGGEDEFARVINVEVMPVEESSFTDVIQLTGTVAASRDVTIAAEESGTIRQLYAEKGDRVRAGQAIAKIDDRVLRAQVEQARARAQLAAETWERRKRLWEEDQVGSELAYLEARSAARETAASLDGLEQRLARTVIRAPFAGTLDSREVEVGTMVNPGTPAGRLVDLDPVKVVGGVPERFAADVEVGTPATVTFDVLPGRYEATLTFVGATVHPRNRTFTVEFTIPNPGRSIKPEMVAKIEVVRDELEEAVVVPREALVRVEEGEVAFVVEEEGDRPVARARTLVLGPTRRNRVVVTHGLDPGDRLIVVGQRQVADGDRVRVVNVQASEDALEAAEAEATAAAEGRLPEEPER